MTSMGASPTTAGDDSSVSEMLIKFDDASLGDSTGAVDQGGVGSVLESDPIYPITL